MKCCYQCNAQVDHLSPRSRCANCEHQCYVATDKQNQELHRKVAQLREENTVVFVVIEGGCVRYVSADRENLAVEVIDLDDQRDAPDEEVAARLEAADQLVRIW